MLRSRAYVDTSVANVISRSTDMVQTMANAPRTIGRAAATIPPRTQTSTAKLSGIAIDSINTRSRSFWSLIWKYATAEPPARIVTPSRSWTSCDVSLLAYVCASFSPPFRPATISPDFPSLLTIAAAAAGGEVHAEDTLNTHGDRLSWLATSVPTRLA